MSLTKQTAEAVATTNNESTEGFVKLNEISRSASVPVDKMDKVVTGGGIDPHHLVSGLDEIPEEVKKNMNGYERMLLDERLLKILFAKRCAVKVDDIVFGMWIIYRQTIDRMTIIRRLNDLVTESKVERIASKRGWYQITSTGKEMFRIIPSDSQQ